MKRETQTTMMDSVQRAHLMRKQSLQRDIFSRHVFNAETVVGAVRFYQLHFSQSARRFVISVLLAFKPQGEGVNDCQPTDYINTNCNSANSNLFPGGANAPRVPTFVREKEEEEEAQNFNELASVMVKEFQWSPSGMVM